MKDSIDRVLDIDEKTSELVKKNEEEIESLKNKLRDELDLMEKSAREKAKEISDNKYDEIINQAEKDKKAGEEDIARRLKSIDEEFEKQKADLINKAFNKFVLGE
ncbi:hypothetical protein [Peptoniphilus catoniae]|uniref:hypothetical protein n=1 Tax=Peptoniphilus catoniae TaxID=1660341 RepID=UPI0010FE6569|nr:hypothetical protein [Peptoniphilus catoniae]